MSGLTVLKTYKAPGPKPAGMAWDGHHLWLNDYQSGRLFQLDPQTCVERSSLLCAGIISGLAWDGHSLWQSRLDEPWLQQINPRTLDIDRTIAIKAAGRLSSVVWDGRQLWVVSQQEGKLLAVEPKDGTVRQSLSIPLAPGGATCHKNCLWLALAYSMTFDAEQDLFVWSEDRRDYALIQLDLSNGKEVSRHQMRMLPLGLAWVGRDLWLADASVGRLLRARLD